MVRGAWVPVQKRVTEVLGCAAGCAAGTGMRASIAFPF